MGIKSNETLEIRLCKDCYELSIWNFDKLVKGDRYEYLIYDYDGVSRYDLDHERCIRLFEEIRNEAFELSNNDQGLFIILLQSEVDYLETRFKTVFILISVLLSGNYLPENKGKYIQELRNWRYNINEGKDFIQELERLSKQHQASKTKINLRKSELKELLEKAKEGKGISLLRQKIKLQRILSMQLDLKKISVAEWFEIIKEATEVINKGDNEQSNKRDR